MDCYRTRSRVASLLFMAIAASDMVLAVVEVVRDVVATTCYYSLVHVPAPFVMSYLALGLVCYCSCISFNVILSVTKTINIVQPFHFINVTGIKVAMGASCGLWFLLGCGDLAVLIQRHGSTRSCYGQFMMLFEYNFVGEGLVLLLSGTFIRDEQVS